jgi:aryl-alcohol dehydrogenase-like predicted oxidoreductase
MRYGTEVSEEESFGIMNKALEVGINFFDTANAYGWAPFFQSPRGHPGQSEEIIGKWLAKDRSRRYQIVLSTKVYVPLTGCLRTPSSPDRSSAQGRSISLRVACVPWKSNWMMRGSPG